MTRAIVTCSEHFTDLALNELRRRHPQLTCDQQLSHQLLLVTNPGSFGNLVHPWKHTPPIYLHHLHPVHHTLDLTGSPEDFTNLRAAAKALSHDDVVVQSRVVGQYPYSATTVNHSINPPQALSDNHTPTGRVLSITIDGQCAYMGISWAGQNLSPFTGGVILRPESVPNRAGYKLLEALHTFDIRLRAGSKALDLGAAPGAWTEILRRRGVHVTAVAPQAMYGWLQADPNVEPVFATAEDYLERCDTAFDILLNDMKLDAQDSAQLMVAYAGHLNAHGFAIMTLKLRLRDPRRLMDHAFRILRRAYRIVYVRQMVSNRKEVTLYLRPK